MDNIELLQNLAPGLFKNGELIEELIISPELFMEHLNVASALPRNVKHLSAENHDGYLMVSAQVSRRLSQFLNVPQELVFSVSIEKFCLTSVKRQCVLKLDGFVNGGHNFAVQLAVTLVEDLLIFMLMGSRVRFASRYTSSKVEWPRVEIDLDTIEEIAEITNTLPGGELWNLVEIENAIICKDNICIPVRKKGE